MNKILKYNNVTNDIVDLLNLGTPVPPKFKPLGQKDALSLDRRL